MARGRTRVSQAEKDKLKAIIAEFEQEYLQTGVPWKYRQIAERMGITTYCLMQRVGTLRHNGEISPRLQLGTPKYRNRNQGKPISEKRGKYRRCLSCREEFWSEAGVFFLCPTHRTDSDMGVFQSYSVGKRN